MSNVYGCVLLVVEVVSFVCVGEGVVFVGGVVVLVWFGGKVLVVFVLG